MVGDWSRNMLQAKSSNIYAIPLSGGLRMRWKLLVIVGIVFLTPFFSNANTIVEQSIHSTTATTPTTTPMQQLGTGISGILGAMSTYLRNTTGGADTYLDFRIYCYDDITYSGAGCNGTGGLVARNTNFNDLLTSTTKELYTREMYLYPYDGSRYEFDPTKYYMIRFTGASQPDYIYGSSSDNYAGGISLNADGLYDLYFEIVDSSEVGTSTRIVQFIEPSISPTASTNVNFQFSYYIGTDNIYDVAGVAISDVTGQQTLIPLEENISASGLSIFSNNKSLEAGHYHLATPYLKNTASSTFLYGSPRGFDVLEDSASSTPFVGDTATSSGFLSFLRVPTILRTKSPTGYLFVISDIMSNLDDVATSSEADLNIDFGQATTNPTLVAIGNLEFFSTSTITNYISDSMLTTIRNLLKAVTYIGTMLALFAMGRSTFT